ncbi:hypothetical protein [Demequina soli]|uniref:hypothetical protein n=1 Tax=Demequina soli TaxID=1638987 RepID=UPI00078195CE|nr:hypothetical protein [Demequina soli]
MKSGTVLGARFTLLDEVDHDIPGIARHLADDLRLGRRTVVDVVESEASGAVRKEATRASRLRDPRLSRIVATGHETVDGVPLTYVAIEHVPGVALDAILDRHRIDARRAVAIVGGAARALAVAQAAGLSHGFVRPACITVTSRGRVVVGGLGVDGEAAERAGLVPHRSERGDAHALAAILVRALTGIDPAEATADDLPDDLPAPARALAVGTMRGAGPATLAELVDALSSADSRALIGLPAAVDGLALTPALEREAADRAAREAAEEERRAEAARAAARALVAAETLAAAQRSAEAALAEEIAEPDLSASIHDAGAELVAEQEAAEQARREAATRAAEQEAATEAIEVAALDDILGPSAPPASVHHAVDRHEAAFDTLEIMVAEQNVVREQGTWELVLEALHRRWPRSEGIARSLRRARERANRGGPLNGSRVVLFLAIVGVVLAVMVALAWLAAPLGSGFVIEPEPSIEPSPSITTSIQAPPDPGS